MRKSNKAGLQYEDTRHYLEQYQTRRWEIEYNGIVKECDYWLNMLEIVSESPEKKRVVQKIETIRQRGIDYKNSVRMVLDEIKTVIESVPDEVLRELLERRYLSGEDWETISCDMAYSINHIHRLHRKALSMVRDMLNQ